MEHQFGSRRKFLKTAGAAALLGGSVAAVFAQEDDDGEEEEEIPTFALGGRVEAWEGLAPSAIADQDNPTLEVVAGETYRIVWRNDDGEPHNIAILDEDDEPLPVLRPIPVAVEEAAPLFNATGENLTTNATFGNVTEGMEPATETPGTETGTPEEELVEVTEIITGEGAVQAVEFEASEEMARYRCEVHPETMVGDLEVAMEDDDSGES